MGRLTIRSMCSYTGDSPQVYSMCDPSGQLTDSDHYLVTAKVRERLSVRKEEPQKFDAERFNLKNESEQDVRKQY